ncbi:MAG TPA: hypothetical protein VGD97_11030 [Lacunisphaera sp.]
MPRPAREILRGWLLPAALLAVAPKCLLCVLAYAGLGAALGLGGPELCGAPDRFALLPLLLGAVGAVGFLLHRFVNRSSPARP